MSEPLTVIGDIHGQYNDLLKILSLTKTLEHRENKLLFLGDYVDRGIYGVECLTLLMAYKIIYPEQVVMLRGNH